MTFEDMQKLARLTVRERLSFLTIAKAMQSESGIDDLINFYGEVANKQARLAQQSKALNRDITSAGDPSGMTDEERANLKELRRQQHDISKEIVQLEMAARYLTQDDSK